MIDEIRKITGDNTITDSDKLYTIKVCDYNYIVFYETKSDYLYMVDVVHGQVTEVSTYERINTYARD